MLPKFFYCTYKIETRATIYFLSQASYAQVADWVSKAWQKVSTQSIRTSFECTGVPGSKDQLHDKLRKVVDGASMDVMDGEVVDNSNEEEELVIEDSDSGLIEDDGTVTIELGPGI